MIKSLVTAAAFTMGLTGYAFAQDTAPGSPAGTKPMTPEPITQMHHPMNAVHHHPSYYWSITLMAAPVTSPTDAPK